MDASRSIVSSGGSPTAKTPPSTGDRSSSTGAKRPGLIEAACAADGPVSFAVGAGTNGRITGAAEAGAVTVDGRDVSALLEGVDMLKIDIEEGEWPIVADRRFLSLEVPVVMLEYHLPGAPSATPSDDARRALKGAGYATAALGETQEGFGVIWG